MTIGILIVEDDEPTRLSLVYQCQFMGYEVTEAPDGETAIDLLGSQRFNVVVTDIILGLVDGMEVLHAARSQPYQPEVIVLTGHGSFETAVTAMREGAFNYLVKPCDPDELILCIQRAAQRQHVDTQLREAARNLIGAFTDANELSKRSERAVTVAAERDITTSQLQSTHTSVGELVVGASRREVTFQGQTVQLTPTEYTILRYLADHVGELCSSCDIAWLSHQIKLTEPEAQSLIKPHIHNLRKKLTPDYLITERGIGYRLVDPKTDEWGHC